MPQVAAEQQDADYLGHRKRTAGVPRAGRRRAAYDQPAGREHAAPHPAVVKAHMPQRAADRIKIYAAPGAPAAGMGRRGEEARGGGGGMPGESGGAHAPRSARRQGPRGAGADPRMRAEPRARAGRAAASCPPPAARPVRARRAPTETPRTRRRPSPRQTRAGLGARCARALQRGLRTRATRDPPPCRPLPKTSPPCRICRRQGARRPARSAHRPGCGRSPRRRPPGGLGRGPP